MSKDLRNNIKTILKDYLNEARLSDIVKFINSDDDDLEGEIKKHLSTDFVMDMGLPTQLTLKKRYKNKKVKVYFTWYDNSVHDLKLRIKERTSFKKISEFVDMFKEVINNIFPDELEKNIISSGRYGIMVREYGLGIIIGVNVNQLFYENKNEIKINVLTIMPNSQLDRKSIKYLFEY